MRSSKERVVKRRLADGTEREYRYSKTPQRAPRLAPDSLGALIAAYRLSPEWLGLAPATHQNRTYYLRDLEGLADLPASAIRRKNLLAIRDAIAATRGNGAANVFMRTAAVLFRWAVDREWIDHIPIERAKALPGGHLPAWTPAEADYAVTVFPEALRRAVILARYTGQRRADLIAMTWRSYDGSMIRVKQQKTGAELEIPAHPILRAELDAWKRDATSTHILTSECGQMWSANHLSTTMSRLLDRHGFRPHLNVHGLRKLAAADLADAGCTAHEIAAITGHATLAMVELYTKSADQKKLATAAIVRLVKRF